MDVTQLNLLSSFPSIKLSYDLVHYNKVLNDYIHIAIPKGIKCFLWYTTIDSVETCFILYLDQYRNVIDIKKKISCFDPNLAKGSVFFGTYFVCEGKSIFCIEDIFFYKGDELKCDLFNKLATISYILNNEIISVSYNKNCLIIGVPISGLNYNDVLMKIYGLNYNIFCIQKRSDNKIANIFQDKRVPSNNDAPHILQRPKLTRSPYFKDNAHNDGAIISAIFRVKADINPDIYKLYCMCNKNLVYYEYAYIPDYKTSEWMNDIFRNIKENKNLDSLEESDDEDEFENSSMFKFVDLEHEVTMKCVLNKQFNRWKPMYILDPNEILNTIQSLPKNVHK